MRVKKLATFVGCFGILLFLLSLMGQSALSAEPGIDIYKCWGAYTWTSNPKSQFTGLGHDILIVDYDGISDGGVSHTVTVTYPNSGPTKTLSFSWRPDDYHAYYFLWDSTDPAMDPSQYSGDYVYRVTRVSDGEYNEVTDNLDVDPIDPPDENTFSPNYGSSQHITAYFDNVYVNGSLYDDFESGFDPTKWQSQPSEVVSTETQIVPSGTITMDGNGDDWSSLTPALIDPQGDGTGGTGVDIKYVYTAMDTTYAYVMVETYNKPISPDAVIEINFDYKAGQHFSHGPHDDLHVNIGHSTLSAWNDNDLDGNLEVYPITDYTVVRGNVMEAKIPLSQIENAAYFNATFVHIWSTPSGGDGSTIIPAIGSVHFEKDWGMATSGSAFLLFTDPDSKNEIKTTVRIQSGTSYARARIAGYFCQNSNGNIYAQIGLSPNEAIYGVEVDYWEGNHFINDFLVPITSLGEVTLGNRYEISIDWDGVSFTFLVHGLDDDVNYSTSFTPPGPTTTPSEKLKGIGVASWLEVDTTTPTFNWTEVAGASHYRIRIYGFNNRPIYTGYTTSPPYTLPPGIVKPNEAYKYRIEAMKDNQWFMADNASGSDRDKTTICTVSDEAENPYIDLHSHGVFTWYYPSPFDFYTYFYLYVHDAQGVPGNIDSVTALFPDGSTQVELYPDYNVSSTCAVYKGVYFGAIQPGIYQFTVIDRDGHSDTKSEILTPDPIGAPPLSSLIPEDGEVIGSTGMTFEWNGVPGAAFYQVDIYDKDFHHLYWAKTISPHLTFPSGVLQEQSLYRYRILTRGEFFEDNLDNMSAMPLDGVWRANTFLTTQKSGSPSNPPTIDLGNIGVAVEEMPHPANGTTLYSLQFAVTVTDPDGVPENIKSVEVIYPDGQTTHLLKYDDVPGAFNYYWEAPEATDASSIQSGTYIFRVEDFEEHVVTVTDELREVTANVLPWPANALPPDSTTLTGTTPLITWDPVPGASYYKVRIMSAWTFPTIHWSGELTGTSYMVPDGVLEPNTTYSYRIYAFREPPGSEFDFFSCNRSWFMTDYHFTTGSQGLVDSDGDGVPDDFEVATCLDPSSPDTDGDGITDGAEDANHNGIVDSGETDPCSADTDADGMPDKWEKDNDLNPTVDDALLDNDGDGYSNLREFISGSSPNSEDATLPTIGTFDSDQDSDGKDLQTVVSEFNREDCSEPNPCTCDLDGDGDVDMVDVALFAEDFGRSE